MKPSADMTCHELEELVTAYLEGALPPPERGRFEAHRQGCPGCQTHVAQLRLAVSTLGQLRSPAGEDPLANQNRMLDLFRARGLHRGETRDRDIPLGFGSELAALGDHIAYFWESEREFDAIAGFLESGASLGEACVLIGHDAANDRMLAGLERRGLSVRALMQERHLQVASVRSSAEELLLEVDERIKDAVDRGMPAVRILGNLNWGRGTPGWPSDREILRLEAHVTRAAHRLPIIVVCAYDVTHLPGPMLLKGGLECHPQTFRRDSLRRNEHHVPPERFLEELSAGSD
ncbi:MAG TPA: MEDS domain-containing protein [Candidatus Polarisedimenticolia bacterium]|nr:MEDS domain-containing protein [Candidatus Polarisedimenticolia bacterium]